MTNEEQKKDDIETMRILFNADINELCNQRRFNNAKEMEGIRDRLIQALESQRWIPVSERLPELKNKYYLWTSTSGLVKMDYYDSKGIWEEAEKYCYEVIAWMPLPQPYRAESEDKEQYETDLQNAYDCGYNSGYAQAMMDIAESEDEE